MSSLYATIARLGAAVIFLAALAGMAAPPQAQAADDLRTYSGSQTGARFLALGLGKSAVIDLSRDAADVLVANPEIANAVVRSARRAYLIGVAAGQTNVIFFDVNGRQIVAYDIEVGRDASGVQAALRRVIPNANIRVDAVNDSVVLSGEVANAVEAQQAVDAATRLVGDVERVVNGLTIRGGEQVLLKVTVAEVQRNVLKQLGVDMTGQVGVGSVVVGFNSNNPFTVQNQMISDTNVNPTFATQETMLDRTTGQMVPRFSLNAQLRAMEQAGVLRMLAEPNLTAVSGEAAEFLAGGEFPIPIPATAGSPPGIEFKNFGVKLDFTPVVLSEGRISMRVFTEVSELSSEGAITIGGTNVPSLRVRRASSVVELPSGGALVLAGLLQENTRQNINGVPGLMNVPILGTLFRSRDYQSGQTELMIMVTPYVVRPRAPQELARPDDGFANPTDPETILLGQLNRLYGRSGMAKPVRRHHGSYGFILD